MPANLDMIIMPRRKGAAPVEDEEMLPPPKDEEIKDPLLSEATDDQLIAEARARGLSVEAKEMKSEEKVPTEVD